MSISSSGVQRRRFVSYLISATLLVESSGLSPGYPSPQTSATQAEEAKGHDTVVKFLKGLRISELPEGKQLLAETMWKGAQRVTTTPGYTEATLLYSGLFDTDVPPIRGYKELFDMKAVTKAGTSRALKYLVICFKDFSSEKWYVFSAIDNVGGSGLDLEQELDAAREWVNAGAKYTSERANYKRLAEWLLRSGRLGEAKAVLEKARGASPAQPDRLSLALGTEPSRLLKNPDRE